MPFYEYKCKDCAHMFEEFQYIDEDPLVQCPKCAGQLKKVLSMTTTQTVKDAKELYEDIKAEAKKDVEDIKNGDWEKAADYLGENGALDFYGKN